MLSTSLATQNVLAIGVAGLAFVGCAIALLLWVDSQIYVPGQSKISVYAPNTIKTTFREATLDTNIDVEPCYQGIVPVMGESLENGKTIPLQRQSSSLSFIYKSPRKARKVLVD